MTSAANSGSPDAPSPDAGSPDAGRATDEGPATDDHDDLARLAALAHQLADRVEATLPSWVERSVERVAGQAGVAVTVDLRQAAAEAGEAAASEEGSAIRALLGRDVDDQPTGPLSLLRSAVRHPTDVLRSAGVRPVARDEVAERLHPNDVYDLSPAAFADVDPALHEPGLMWGAAKAHVVLARRRREGRR